MVVTTPPTCADSCILNAVTASSCNYQYSCLCRDQTYLAAAHACVLNLCDTADQQLWATYGNQQCADVGVFSVFSGVATSSAAPIATTVTAGVATGKASPSTALPTSAIIISTTLTNGNGVVAATAANTQKVITSSNAYSNSPSITPTSSSPGSTPSSSDSGSGSGSGSGGLSVADIAGIASAVLTAAALLVAILAWQFPSSRRSLRQAFYCCFRCYPRNTSQSHPGFHTY